jgi:rhodanese-related sulfurtransferase
LKEGRPKMSRLVSPTTLKEWLHDGREIALFDVREHGQYGESHLFYAVPLPYSRLEADVPRLAPRPTVRLVVYDGGEGVAERAAPRLQALGYTDVHVLQGGAPAWRAAGFALFAGVHVPSKAFGELVEHVYSTPRMGPAELDQRLARQEALVVLDGRPVSEFSKMNIPTATCCPNGELAYRVRQLVPDERTAIVINCAGRTRSIIGAQTLINLGLPNPVFALENGTQGWYLQGLALEHGGTRRYGEPAAEAEMRVAAQRLAKRFAVPRVAAATVREWTSDPQRSLFLLDVRTPEEYARGSLPGARHAPGGQLLQALDQYVGVRHARLVLFDAEGIRALTVASWLRQMGHDAVVLEGGLASGLALTAPSASLPQLPPVDAAMLAEQMAAGSVLLLDLRGSMRFREAHIAGARWTIRPRLAQAVAGDTRTIVLVTDEAEVAACAATDLRELGHAPRMLDGGMAAWRQAGLPVESGAGALPDTECIDFLFFVHDRHDGNKEAARRYLAWETGLLAQLDERELATFALPPARAQSAALAD